MQQNDTHTGIESQTSLTNATTSNMSAQIFSNLCLVASQICNASIAFIALTKNNQLQVVSSFGAQSKDINLDNNFYKKVTDSPTELFELSNTKDKGELNIPMTSNQVDAHFHSGVTLKGSSGKTLGVLAVIDTKSNKFSVEQKKALKVIADQLIHQIEKGKKSNLEKKASDTTYELTTLQRNNFLYRSLIESAPLGIIISDKDDKRFLTNTAFEEMLGYSKEELSSVSAAALTHPDDVEETRKKISKLKAGKVRHFTMEKRYIKKNGGIIWGRVASGFVPDEDDKPAYYITTIEDITRQKGLYEENIEVKNRLERALIGTRDGVIDWSNISSTEQWWSPRVYEMLGYTSDELPSTTETFFSELLHPEDKPYVYLQVEECILKGKPYEVDFRLQTKNNGYRWFRGKGNVTEWKRNIPYRMTGSISDIDTNKKLEVKLKETESFLSNVTNIVPDIITVLNLKTKLVEYINDGVSAVLGYSAQEFAAFGEDLFQRLCHPEDLEDLLNYFTKVAKLDDSETTSNEYRLKNKNGDYRWILSKDTVFERDKDGVSTKQLSILTDITNLKTVQQKLSDQAIKLQRQNNHLKQFNYVATHDLKSPLITLKAYFEILQKELTNSSSEVTSALNFMQEEFENFRITQEGLTQAIRLREDEINIESIDANKIIDELTHTYRKKIKGQGGELIVKLDSEAKVKSSRVYIKSVIDNLISNAIKYKSDKRPIVIQINTCKSDKYLNINIKDNGLGIDLELQKDKIFGMFNRFHHHSEGSGMGLYMVKNMVERLGGRISIESEVDKGTSFHIQLALA